MPSSTRARRNPALVLIAVLAGVFALVASTLSTPSLAAATGPASAAPKVAKKHDRVWRAKVALARAQKAFSPSTPASERPDATMALRDLWLLKDALSPADRAIADRLSARPDKPAVIGDANISLHYDPAELNPAAYDANTALQTVQYVANTYAGSGYRRPKSDRGKGGSNAVDIYLDQLEPGLYGYCTTDQRKYPRGKFDVWAFCVLDADYAGFQRTPLENLQVTAAHEYFHATQYAYDANEDRWLLEATATWAEDELYDNINDNVQYLRSSPISSPGHPLDKFEDNGVFQYGAWNFFRFLTERFPEKTGALPGLILQIWKNADSSKGPRKDRFSTQAIDKALRKHKTRLGEAFTAYSAATRLTHTPLFSEGVEQNYPIKPLAGQATLPGGAKKSFKTKLDHLTSQTFQYVNGGGASKLKVSLRMAAKFAGSRAVAVLYAPNGAVVGFENIKVNNRGKGKKKFTFDGNVSAVDITLVNASTDYRDCYTKGRNPVACYGKAVYDNLRAKVTAKAA